MGMDDDEELAPDRLTWRALVRVVGLWQQHPHRNNPRSARYCSRSRMSSPSPIASARSPATVWTMTRARNNRFPREIRRIHRTS